MSLFARLRLDIRGERIEIAAKESTSGAPTADDRHGPKVTGR